jgi:transposase InsO family protein
MRGRDCERLLQGRTRLRTRTPGPWKTVEDLELATLGWMHPYNTLRLHCFLGDFSAVEFENAFYVD